MLARYTAGEWNVEIPLIISNHPDLQHVAELSLIHIYTLPNPEGMAIAAPANAAVLRNPRRLISILLFSAMILCFMHYNLMNGKCPVH